MTTKTALARRAELKIAYDAFFAACPTRELLQTISGKWVTLIVAALGDGSQRYSQIAERVAGISPKMLTQTLRSLESDGLIGRTVTPTVPVRVDYTLTALGQNFYPLIMSIKDWAEAHMDQVHQARKRQASSRSR